MNPSHRAERALGHLREIDPALAVLALWCRHVDGDGATHTQGQTISYGPSFETLSLPEQVGVAAHHVLHVALRHSDRQATMAERLGDAFDPYLYGLAADGVINQTLALGGHALPRPAVMLEELLQQIGEPAKSPIDALAAWDVDRLAMALHADPARAEKATAWGRKKEFTPDIETGRRDDGDDHQSAADWRNQMLRAFEAGRSAGSGIGKFGAILADIAPARVPWEVHLRGLMARALTNAPQQSYRRPANRWIAMSAEARRHGTPDPVFEPGLTRRTHRPRLVIGLDTSSSIDPLTLRLFTSEAEAITRRSGAEAHLLAFDEVVYLQTRLDPGGWGQLLAARLRTGGGTDFNDLFTKAAALSPSLTIVLTDLDAPIGPPPRYPVLWAVPADVPAPAFGKLVRIGEV